jgi:PAS domain S-box-containing protein
VESQKQLQQNEEKFRTLIEQASDGIFISNFRGEYIDVNSNGLKLSGYTMEELKNLTIYDLIPPGDEDSNPIKMEELFGGNVVINERRMRCKDGSIVNVEISAKLLTDGRFLGIVRDITTRKKAEEALKLSEEKYRLLFYQNPMPMWMISVPERNFLDVNSAAMDFYGYSKEEFLSMNIMDIRPPEEIQPVKRAINNMPKGINRAGTWTHLKKDGTRIRVSIISHDIMYEGKAAKLILANDVSERLLAEEKLQESHEAFRQLATHLETVREAERTHMAREIHDELGQQLTGLKMDISWLNKKIKTDDQEVQQKIQETILLIDSTVKSVRRIATELRPSILDDLGLVAAMEWHSEEFEKRFKISCIFESKVTNEKIPPGLTTGIFRIYQECLTNVLRHSEASEVRSFLDIVDDKLRLQITDNGKGFIVEEIANKKTLGLLGMKERASLMGGTYEIFSNPGKGTSILIIVSLNSN